VVRIVLTHFHPKNTYSVNCTGAFLASYNCTVIDASMVVYTNGNETYDDLLLPILKEYMDSGRFNDLHPAIVNVTFLNQTEESNDDDGRTTTTGPSGIQNPALFAIIGVAVVIAVIGYVIYKKKKDKRSVGTSEAGEAAPQSDSVAKGVPTSSKKDPTAYTPVVQDVSVQGSILQDNTFDLDSDEDEEEFAC